MLIYWIYHKVTIDIAVSVHLLVQDLKVGNRIGSDANYMEFAIIASRILIERVRQITIYTVSWFFNYQSNRKIKF